MKPILYLLLMVLALNSMQGQNDSQNLSFTFENMPLQEALMEIEKQTNYKFYFAIQWIDDQKVTGHFESNDLERLLEQLFDDTVINFYILPDNKIALSRNSIIYDKLPIGFFGEWEEVPLTAITNPQKSLEPVFLSKSQSISKEIETIRIGKGYDNSKSKFSLKGYVYHKKTGDPIPNLSILVKNSKLGTTTDGSGFYQIELPPGIHLIETRSLGIEPTQKNIIIYNDGSYNFHLDEDIELLDEVVVSADASKNVEETVMSATELSSEETKNVPVVLGERNILKVATTLPGINSVGEGATGFNVRGGNADQNLVLMDDAVLYNPTHFFGIFQALNPFTVSDLKIYKGSIPAEFGGRLSSVFDISNKDANTEKFAGEASIGPVTNNLALEIPVIEEKASILLGGRSSYSDWILRSLDEETLKNSKASFFDVIAKYRHDINDNNTIRTTAYYSRDAFSITSDSLYNYSNRTFSMKWSHRFNEKSSGDLILANSGYQFNIDFDGQTNTDFRFGFNVDETEFKLKFNYLSEKTHNWNYGFSSKLYSIDPGNLSPGGDGSIIEPLSLNRERALESALFVSDVFDINEKLKLDLGFRYSVFFALGTAEQRLYQAGLPRTEGTLVERVQSGNNEIVKTYTGPEFRFSGRYFLGKDFSLKASFNRSYQYIHTLSNNTTVSPIDTWKLSDINIRPQSGNQYAIGLYKNLADNNIELSLEGYYKKSNNNLDFKVGADLLLNETIETEVLQGEGKAYGVEFLIKKNLGRLNGWLGYTFSRSFIKLDSDFPEELVNNGEYFPANYDRPHDLSIITNYKFTRRFSLSANFVYQTGRPVTYPVGNFTLRGANYAFYSDRNKFRIPDYYRLDLSFNVEGNHKLKKLAHSFWNISIYNILGRNNPYSVFFVTDNGDIKAYKSTIFSIPIPTITYNFKF